jgi:translation initiation factor IF-2
VQNLLENILLFAADFKVNLGSSTQGVVIDSYLHSSTDSHLNELLIQSGQLQEKDTIFLRGKFGKVKVMFDIRQQKIITATTGDIVKVIGLNILAELGDRFLVVNDEKTAVLIEKELTNY